MTRSKLDGVKDWQCPKCGWEYHSPIPLYYPPIHRCNPRSRTKTTCQPAEGQA